MIGSRHLKPAKKYVCSIFFDIRNAFDSVPHRLLVDKLTSLGLDVHTISWITSYLPNQKQHVVVGRKSSQDVPVLSGVPLGSVLGPLLFLVYINDVSNIHLSDGSILNLYADDMLLYKSIKSFGDYSHLRFEIDCINNWASRNKLMPNPIKCKAMTMSRKRKSDYHTQFFFNGTPLEQVETFKYLGVLISSDLSWSAHSKKSCWSVV